MLYHLANRHLNIRRETSASLGVFSLVSSVSMVALLVQIQSAREGEVVVPLFKGIGNLWGKMLKGD